MKIIETLKNTVNLIIALATLAVLGGFVYGGLWVYHKFAEFTATPPRIPDVGKMLPEKISMPSVEVPKIKMEMPEIKLKAPVIDLSGLLGRNKNREVLEAWEEWKAKTKEVVAGLSERQIRSGGHWQDANTGRWLARGWKTLTPPRRGFMTLDGVQELRTFEWAWIYAGPVPEPTDLSDRLRAGNKPGRWFCQKNRYCIYGWRDLPPPNQWNYFAGRSAQTGDTWFWMIMDWVWIEDGRPLPQPAADPEA